MVRFVYQNTQPRELRAHCLPSPKTSIPTVQNLETAVSQYWVLFDTPQEKSETVLAQRGEYDISVAGPGQEVLLLSPWVEKVLRCHHTSSNSVYTRSRTVLSGDVQSMEIFVLVKNID